MNTERLKYLYEQYQSGRLNGDEEAEWQQALADLSQDKELFALLDADWYRDDLHAPELESNEQENMYRHIIAQPQQARPVTRVRLWPRIAAAASIILAIGAGLFYFNQNSRHTATEMVAKNDVLPGKQGATLTLANGKKIRLTEAQNGELAKEAGVTITKSANGQLIYEIKDQENHLNQINTLSTSKGETYQVRLPDGSAVWLNSASSLTYSANLLREGKRRVTLTGEGYFEIAKDKAHPFIVQTANQDVEVLGTHFNINSYDDEPAIATTLLEGLVKVSSGANQQIIKPGEQALNNGENLKVYEANVTEVIAWKEGFFRFNEAKMSSIVKQLERWYDVDIQLSDKLANEEFTGKIARNRNISRVLKMMEKTNSIHFKIEGRRIVAIEK